MGKYFIQYGVPALILLPLIYWVVRKWYVKRFGAHVEAQLEVNAKTAEYNRELGIGATINGHASKPDLKKKGRRRGY